MVHAYNTTIQPHPLVPTPPVAVPNRSILRRCISCRRIFWTFGIWNWSHEWDARSFRMVMDLRAYHQDTENYYWTHGPQILEGIATVAVGILAFFSRSFKQIELTFLRSSLTATHFQVLVDFPVTAKFLTPEERAFVVYKKSAFFLIILQHKFVNKYGQNMTIRLLVRRSILKCGTWG